MGQLLPQHGSRVKRESQNPTAIALVELHIISLVSWGSVKKKTYGRVPRYPAPIETQALASACSLPIVWKSIARHLASPGITRQLSETRRKKSECGLKLRLSRHHYLLRFQDRYSCHYGGYFFEPVLRSWITFICISLEILPYLPRLHRLMIGEPRYLPNSEAGFGAFLA